MKSDERVAAVAAIITDGRRHRTSKPLLAPELYPAWDEVYRIHDVVDADLGKKVIGWKVGAADQAVRDVEGLPDAILGRIYSESLFASPADVPADMFINFRQCEAEVVLEIGRGFSVGDPEVTAEDILDATTGVYPGLEVGDMVFKDWYGSNPFWGACIDNAGGAVLVLGEKADPAQVADFGDIDVTLLVNDVETKTGTSQKAMESPLISAAWIVNNTLARGYNIPAGAILSTGTTTGHCFVNPGDKVELRFEGVGSVEAVLN